MILSLLGMSVSDKKSRYENNTSFEIQDSEFTNSIDALLNSFDNEKFIFLGTEESIKAHKAKFADLIEQRDVEFKKYKNGDLDNIFIQIMQTLIDYQTEDIMFDITHSFRDSVIMSVISTIVSQIIYKPNISMIYAKEIPSKKITEETLKTYQYTLVSDKFLDNANIATILSTFLSTFKVPPLNSQYKLYQLLHTFSTHLVSNQFNDIYEQDIGNLENFIKTKREELFFVKPLLNKLEILLNDIKNIKDKNTSGQFVFFSELFVDKDYFLQSSTYLIEAITYYIGEVFNDLGYIEFDMKEYSSQQKIVALLKLNYNAKDYNFPNDYFIDINIDIINKFYFLREKVAKIRHNLAHINIEQDYGDIKEELESYIEEFNNLINKKVLYSLETTESEKKNTVKHQLELLQKQVNRINKQKTSFTKVNTIFDKYYNNKLSDLTLYDTEKLKDFCKNNLSKYKKLIKAKQKRELCMNK